ncbi:MAG: carbohydrate-binding protein [Bryobacteraceae bacterium]
MRKRIVETHLAKPRGEPDQGWLDLEQIATVEVTSEDPKFPIESAFDRRGGPGWRASQKGEQQIRIIFDEPMSLHHIQLRFHEAECQRTQEFTLRWSSAAGGPANEIVRQQWNFSPTGSTTEIEDYAIDLSAVSVLELTIRPDLGHRERVATLTAWHLR